MSFPTSPTPTPIRFSPREQLLKQAVAIGGLLLSMKLCMQYLDPYKEQRDKVTLDRLGDFVAITCSGVDT